MLNKYDIRQQIYIWSCTGFMWLNMFVDAIPRWVSHPVFALEIVIFLILALRLTRRVRRKKEIARIMREYPEDENYAITDAKSTLAKIESELNPPKVVEGINYLPAERYLDHMTSLRLQYGAGHITEQEYNDMTQNATNQYLARL